MNIWRAPAVQALILQCATFPITLLCVYLLVRADIRVDYTGVALIQGAFAGLLTWWRKLALWWILIQLLFPLALLKAQLLSIPPIAFLAAFLFLLALYWSTFRTQVPYYPSGRHVWDAVARLLPAGRPVRAIDIGSGLGGLVLDLAKRRPDSRFVGIELAPLPWLISLLRAKMAGNRAQFLRGDYNDLHFADYDAVFAYLSPAAMSALYRKAKREMRPGSILLSYEFLITERAPDLDIVPTGRGPSLYVWHF